MTDSMSVARWFNAAIITPATSLEKVKEIHQKIWDYAIEYGEKPHTPYISNCAACEYAGGDCDKCPIEWTFNGQSTKTCYDGGAYSWWKFSSGETRTELAKVIRDMPFKYELDRDKIKTFAEEVYEAEQTEVEKATFQNSIARVLSNIDQLKDRGYSCLDDLQRPLEEVVTLFTDLRKRGLSWESIFEKLFDESFRRLRLSEPIFNGERGDSEVPLQDSGS